MHSSLKLVGLLQPRGPSKTSDLKFMHELMLLHVGQLEMVIDLVHFFDDLLVEEVPIRLLCGCPHNVYDTHSISFTIGIAPYPVGHPIFHLPLPRHNQAVRFNGQSSKDLAICRSWARVDWNTNSISLHYMCHHLLTNFCGKS